MCRSRSVTDEFPASRLDDLNLYLPRLGLLLLQLIVLVGTQKRAKNFNRGMSQKVSKRSSVESSHDLYSFTPSNHVTLTPRALASATSSKSRTPRIPVSIFATPARSIETLNFANLLESSSCVIGGCAFLRAAFTRSPTRFWPTCPIASPGYQVYHRKCCSSIEQSFLARIEESGQEFAPSKKLCLTFSASTSGVLKRPLPAEHAERRR